MKHALPFLTLMLAATSGTMPGTNATNAEAHNPNNVSHSPDGPRRKRMPQRG